VSTQPIARGPGRASQPGTRGPQARGRVTRARILRAAEERFTRGGYDGSSVGDVARTAGVGVGTVYHHFPDKRSMLLELVEDWGERVAARRRSELEMERFVGDAPRASIARWLGKTYERLRAEPSLYVVVLALADRDPEVRRRYQRIEQSHIERVRELIAFGQRRGVMRASLDAASAAFLIHHAIDTAATQLLVREVEDPAPERVLGELVDMICRYILEESR